MTPSLEGTSTPVKATCDERRPEQEPRESEEELRFIHDKHGIKDARASMEECIYKKYNQQREVSASGDTQTRNQVLRDKTNVVPHGTAPQKNNCTGKPKHTFATGTNNSPRARQDYLAR